MVVLALADFRLQHVVDLASFRRHSLPDEEKRLPVRRGSDNQRCVEGRCVLGVSQLVPGGGEGPKKQPLRPIVIERLLIPRVGPPVNPGR